MRALPVNLLNAALASAGIADDRCITGFEVLGQFSAHRASVVRLRVAFSLPRVGDPVSDRTTQTVVDEIVSIHARFWNHPILHDDRFTIPVTTRRGCPKPHPLPPSAPMPPVRTLSHGDHGPLP